MAGVLRRIQGSRSTSLRAGFSTPAAKARPSVEMTEVGRRRRRKSFPFGYVQVCNGRRWMDTVRALLAAYSADQMMPAMSTPRSRLRLSVMAKTTGSSCISPRLASIHI